MQNAATVDLNAERLQRALSASVNRFELRRKALKFAMRYVSGTRYAGADHVKVVARALLVYTAAGTTPEQIAARETWR